MVKRFERFKLSTRKKGKVELCLGDIQRSREICENSLVGKIFGDNVVNFTGLKKTMTKLWCRERRLKVTELNHKIYQFVFSCAEERRRVLEKRPWLFDNKLLVLQPWQKDIEKKDEALQSAQMWVQVWNIPVHWISAETAWKIMKGFGKCNNVIVPKNGSKEGRYVKMFVEVELTKPLIRGTKICFEGETRWVNFKYEQLPFFCFYCGVLGHGERLCNKKMKYVENDCLSEGQFGEWLRAASGRVGNAGIEKDRLNQELVILSNYLGGRRRRNRKSYKHKRGGSITK